jgi:hypothetical protein
MIADNITRGVLLDGETASIIPPPPHNKNCPKEGTCQWDVDCAGCRWDHYVNELRAEYTPAIKPLKPGIMEGCDGTR